MNGLWITTYALAGWLMLLADLLSTGLAQACPATLSFEKRPLNGNKPVRLCQAYQDKIMVIVNTAN